MKLRSHLSQEKLQGRGDSGLRSFCCFRGVHIMDCQREVLAKEFCKGILSVRSVESRNLLHAIASADIGLGICRWALSEASPSGLVIAQTRLVFR